MKKKGNKAMQINPDFVQLEAKLLNFSKYNEKYFQIKSYAEELKLPKNDGQRTIGFGNFDGFYMFWIQEKDGEMIFSCRKEYIKAGVKEDNVLRFELSSTPFEVIKLAIDKVYQNSEGKRRAKDSNDDPKLRKIVGIAGESNLTENAGLQEALDDLKSYVEGKSPEQCNFHRLMSVRLYNVFRRNNISNFKDLAEKSAKEIWKFRWCGRKCVLEIIELINEFVQNIYKTEKPKIEEEKISRKPIEERVKECLINKKYLDADFSEENREKMQKAGQELYDIVLRFLDNLSRFGMFDDDLQRDIRIVMQYYGFEGEEKFTLRDLGEMYGISKERVRQILKKQNRSLPRKLNKEEFSIYKIQILILFNKIADTDFVEFVKHGLLSNFLRRVAELILRLLFSEAIVNELFYVCNKYKIPKTISIEEKRLLAQADKNQNWFTEASLFFEEKSDVKIDFSALKSSANGETSYNKKARNFIEMSDDVEAFVEYPKEIILSRTSGIRKHPDFVLKLKNGKIVIVLIVNTLNSVTVYNMKIRNNLKAFCQDYNCGYIILDKKLNSITNIDTTKINGEVEIELNRILERNQVILLKDIQELKSIFGKSKLQEKNLAAYIIKNNLDFKNIPFKIKRKREEEWNCFQRETQQAKLKIEQLSDDEDVLRF